MSATLTFTSSVEEIISGIPKTVEISSDVPAIIYYTLDGSVPTEDSFVYADPIELPDNVFSVSIKAFAIDSNLEESEVFSSLYGGDITRLDRTHIVGAEGLVVDRVADERDNVVGYDYSGSATSYADEELIDLELVYSSQGYDGTQGAGTAIDIDFIDPDESSYPFDDNFVASSTTEYANMFDPYAYVTFMDSRKDNEVNVINRPHGSLRTAYREFGGFRLTGAETYVSGGIVRTYYSASNNIMVSYYYDNNTNRWIRAIDKLPAMPNTGGWNNLSQPLVFKWISRGRQSNGIV